MKIKFLSIFILIFIISTSIVCYTIKEKESLLIPEIRSDDPGLPIMSDSHQIVKHTYYTLSYNEKYEQADWVMYLLTASYITQPSFDRTNDFREDTLVSTGSAQLSDYKYSGYDRGHLCPAADMDWSEQALYETFYLSNMSPQKPGFNRGIWKRLESQVRDWALTHEELYVVTGPVLTDSLSTIGENKVGVPNYFYKIVFDYHEPDVKAIGFVMANKSLSGSLFNYAVTIDSVEQLTGIDFFPSLPDGFENTIESAIDTTRWKNN